MVLRAPYYQELDAHELHLDCVTFLPGQNIGSPQTLLGRALE